MSTSVRQYLPAAGAAALALLCFAAFDVGSPPWDAMVLLTVLFFLTERYPLNWTWNNTRWALTLSPSLAIPAVFHHPGTWLGVVVLLGALAAQLSRGRRDPHQLATAVGAVAAAAALGGGLMTLFGPYSFLGVAVSLPASVAVRHAVLLAAAAGGGRRSAAEPGWSATMLTVLSVHTVSNLGIGALAAWLLGSAPWALVGLATPVALFLVAWRMLAWKADQADLLEQMLSSYHRTRATSAEESMLALLGAADRLCRGDAAAGEPPSQMVFLSPAQSRLFTLSGTQATSLDRTDPGIAGIGWVTQALTHNDRVRFDADPDTGTVFCVIRIGFGNGVRVVMRIHPAQETFMTRARVRRVGDLVSVSGETWLAQARATSSDEALLRDACARLVRLVSVEAPPVADVLAEVHTIGELTATLLGDGDLPVPEVADSSTPAGTRRVAMGRFPTR